MAHNYIKNIQLPLNYIHIFPIGVKVNVNKNYIAKLMMAYL